MNPYYDFLKRLSDRTSSEKIMEAMPDFYGQVPKEINQAIEDEINSYEISGVKKDYIRAKIRGSIVATFKFDEDFIRQYKALTSDADKIFLLRKYLREYVKKEINLEAANLEREARNKIITKDGKEPRSLLSILDPRWKKNAKPGDYKQYKQYRDEVTGLLFPEKDLASKSSQSTHFKDLKELVKTSKSGGLPLTFLATGALVSPLTAINNIAKSRFKYIAKNTQVYNSAAKGFLTLEEQIILGNIDKKIRSDSSKGNKESKHVLIKEGISEIQKIELVRAISSGSLSNATKFFNINSKGKVGSKQEDVDPADLFKELAEVQPEIVLDSSGNEVVKNDTLQEFYSNSADKFTEKVKKDSTNAAIDFQQAVVVSNITATRSLIQSQGTAVDAKLTEHLKANELVNDILNLSKSLKDADKLTGADAKKLNDIKQNILNSVTSGLIKFSSEVEKNQFVTAIKTNNYKFIKKFATPGLLGGGTFATLIENINRNSFDLAAKYNSPELASRALNFNNYLSVFRKTILDSYIYAAQLGFDQGYLVSEIKDRLKKSRFSQILAIYDTPFTWDTFKQNARKTVIKQSLKFGSYLQKTFKLKKGPSQGDLEAVLDLFSGKKTYGELAKKWVEKKFYKFLQDKFKVSVDFTKEITLKNFLESKFVNDVKLKVLKNLRFLEKRLQLFAGKRFAVLASAAKMGLSKLGGKLPPIVSKILNRGWFSVSGFFGRFLTVFGKKRDIFSSTSSMLVSIQTFVVGCFAVSIFLFILGVLIFISTLSGSYSSTSSSSSSYLPGAYSDVLLDNFQPYDQNIEASRINASANYCMTGDKLTSFESSYPNWNNLKLADFEGTDDANNCKIMCNARKLLAGLAPGNNGLLSCNINASILPTNTGNAVQPEFYVCTDFVTHSFFDDDENMGRKGGRSVIQVDSYLKSVSDSSNPDRLYERVDLAQINNPDNEATLNEFSPICQDLSNFKAGNVLIIRANTCNDKDFVGGPVRGLSYKTIDHLGRPADVWGAHIEIMLKVEGSGNERTLYTLNANNVAKKPRWKLKKCATGDKFYLERKLEATSLKGYPLDNEGKPLTVKNSSGADVPLELNYVTENVYGYPCRMYQIKRKTFSCFDKCEIPPSNYPDRDNY